MNGAKLALLCVVILATAVATTGGIRGLLWHTVTACLLDHRIIGSPFPCLAVQTNSGRGYVVLRGPLDESHVVLSPAIKLAGIEAPALRAPDAPNYIADAWHARAFAYPSEISHIPQSEMALAINSQWGRTQDQLHIHIDCLRPGVKARILQQAPNISSGSWLQIEPTDWAWGEPYLATALGDNLRATNEIAAAASALGLSGEAIKKLSIAVVATRDDPDHPNFVLLAQAARSETSMDGHAEELLNHDCGDRQHQANR